MLVFFFFFFQAEDGIRDVAVTGVQTCALPICERERDEGGCAGTSPASLQQHGSHGSSFGPACPGQGRVAVPHVVRHDSSYFRGARSEFQMSPARSQEPSACLRRTTSSLPESLIARAAPGGVKVM